MTAAARYLDVDASVCGDRCLDVVMAALQLLVLVLAELACTHADLQLLIHGRAKLPATDLQLLIDGRAKLPATELQLRNGICRRT